MATTTPDPFTHGGSTNQTRHSKEDALSAKAFERLYEASYQLEEYYGLQARFVLVAAGRLGLRAGEIVHLTEEWIDWDTKRIEIPRYEPCRMGRGGTVCGHCRQAARQQVEYAEHDLDVDAVLEQRWHPKTETAIRGVPFDFSARVEHVVESFFARYSEFPVSYQSLKRRVKWVSETTAGVDRVYPHALRATAATLHAGRGLDVYALQSLMGWAQLATAEKYVSTSDGAAQRALRDVHSR